MKVISVQVAEVKRHFADYVARSALSDCRVIIKRRERPAAALVSLEDLRRLEQSDKRAGLASVAARWKSFDEIAEDTLLARRQSGEGRHVSF